MIDPKTPYELFGNEVGKGWQGIVQPLIALCKAEGVEILQIKEKFGTLRFYVSAAPEHVLDAIDEAEKGSRVTCEDCGARGKARDDGWIRTLCDDCNK
jgi:hypothetical protein